MDGRDFFNVFILCGPDGNIAGTARKDNAEAFCLKRGLGIHVIETTIGRIGCRHLRRQPFRSPAAGRGRRPDPDAPTPVRTTRLVSERDIREQREKPQQLAALYARCLGVPVAFVNGIGRMAPLAGPLGRVMPPDVFYLEGRSRIIDSDGTLKAALGDEAGVITADATLDRSRKRSIKPTSYAGWLHPGSAIARNVIIPLEIAFGVLSYRLDPRRRRKARAVR
jgi:N-carbamoylputrescine amidase